MREIKFRVWDKIDNELRDVEEICFYKEWLGVPVQISEDEAQLEQRDFKNIVLMQYTGLEDKNGKEIYEGDLIKCVYCKEECGIVIWNNGMLRFQLSWPDKDCGNARHTGIDSWSEVVGNIYENPELL